MKRERFVDIYRDNEAMNKAIDIKKIKFYLWVGLGYFLIGLMTTAGKYPDKFLFALLNSIWGIIYVIVVN
jgi:two-component system LytT family sensor kinase